MLKKPREPYLHQIENNSQLIKSYQRLNDMLLALHVVVDRKFHQLANENPDGAVHFVNDLMSGLKAIYCHPEFRSKGWQADQKKKKAEASEAWKQALEALRRKVSELSNTSAAKAENAGAAETERVAAPTSQNSEIDCSPLCVDNGVCVPCDLTGN